MHDELSVIFETAKWIVALATAVLKLLSELRSLRTAGKELRRAER